MPKDIGEIIIRKNDRNESTYTYEFDLLINLETDEQYSDFATTDTMKARLEEIQSNGSHQEEEMIPCQITIEKYSVYKYTEYGWTIDISSIEEITL